MEDGPSHPTLRSRVVSMPRRVPQPLPVARQTQELPGSRTRQRCWIVEYTHEKKRNSLRKPILIMDALEKLPLLHPMAVRAVTVLGRGAVTPARTKSPLTLAVLQPWHPPSPSRGFFQVAT